MTAPRRWKQYGGELVGQSRSAMVIELDVLAANFVEALLRRGLTELADDFNSWWDENRPEDDDDDA